MQQVQFIGISPEQLKKDMADVLKAQIDELKNHFQPKDPTEWLTRNEVRDLLKVDLSTIHHWTKKGKLKSYGLGARVYYKRSEVESALIKL